MRLTLPTPRSHAVVRPVAVVMIVLLVAAMPGAAQAVKGDPQAWEEVKAALDRLAALRTYRMTMAFVGEGITGAARDELAGMTSITEVVNPDRRRMVMEMPTGTAEAIIVGRQMAHRFVSKTPITPAAPQPSFGLGSILSAFLDPIGFVGGLIMQAATNALMQAAIQRLTGWQCRQLDEQRGAGTPAASEPEVEVTRLADASIGGAPTRVYRVVWKLQQQASEQRFYVSSSDGLPRRTEMLDQGKVMLRMDYQDFNAPITIELPRCG